MKHVCTYIYALWAVWGRQRLMNWNMGLESSPAANWSPHPLTPLPPDVLE